MFTGPSTAQCVSLEAIAKSATNIRELTDKQFFFALGVYVAIPPYSRNLPPGSKLYEATAGKSDLLAFESAGQVCARFMIPPFVREMMDAIGRGELGQNGDPT